MRLKNFLFAIVVLVSISVAAQDDAIKQRLSAKFDYVAFNADSSIRGLYMITGFKFDGFSIEFDASGNPEAMGYFENGIKQGQWIFSDGSSTTYVDGESQGISWLGCGTGRYDALLRFREQYEALLSCP